MSGKGGNHVEEYYDWSGPGKTSFPSSRRIDGGTRAISREAVAAEFPQVHGGAASCCSRDGGLWQRPLLRSEEHTSELQSLMRSSYAVFCLKKKNKHALTNLHMH